MDILCTTSLYRTIPCASGYSSSGWYGSAFSDMGPLAEGMFLSFRLPSLLNSHLDKRYVKTSA